MSTGQKIDLRRKVKKPGTDIMYRMFNSKRQLDYWDRRIMRDDILITIFVAVLIVIIASFFI